MTEQQPKEYCIGCANAKSEETGFGTKAPRCAVTRWRLDMYDVQSMIAKIGCKHDTRSRTATAPNTIADSNTGEILPFGISDDDLIDFNIWLKEHDAEIRKDEREKVLDIVIQFAKTNDCVQSNYGDQDCKATSDTECIICFCESFREREP